MDSDEEKDKTNHNKKQENEKCSSFAKDIQGEKSVRRRTEPGPSIEFPFIVPASPPAFVSFEQLLKIAEDVSKSETNMALAHEIAVNQDFSLLENKSSSSLEKKVSEICHKAFWDLLKQNLSSDPPDYGHAMTVLKEIKEILLWLLLPHNSRLKNEINEVLDISLIEQQVQNGAIDVSSYAQFIISTMSRICAPVRDSNIQELRQLTDIIELFKGILETLDLMKLDMVNFTISHMRPHIQQHSVEYEKDKFKEILCSLESLNPPLDGLKFTRSWLQNAYSEAVADGNEPSNSAVIRKACVKILTWKETEMFPETLHLDHERFINLRNNLTVIILTASIILVVYSTVGPVIQGISEFKKTLKKHLQIILADASECSIEDLKIRMEAAGTQVVKEVNECLETHGYPILTKENQSLLMSSIINISEDDHHVRQLITKRALEFLELSIQPSSTLRIPPGLSSLQDEISKLAAQFFSLVKHNQLVFDDYYNDILESFKTSQ